MPDDISTILKIKCAEGYAAGGVRKVPFTTGSRAEEWPPRRLIEGSEREEVSQYYRFAYDHRRLWENTRSLANVGLIYSLPTHLWNYFPAFGRYPGKYKDVLCGWSHTLEEQHIPYDILMFGHPRLFNHTVSVKRNGPKEKERQLKEDLLGDLTTEEELLFCKAPRLPVSIALDCLQN